MSPGSWGRPRELIADMKAFGYECLRLEAGWPGRAVRDIDEDIASVVFEHRSARLSA